MSALRPLAWLAVALAAATTAAPLRTPPPAVREDLPHLLREAARATPPAARVATWPAGPQPASQRFDPQVTGFGAIGDRYGSALAVDGDTLLVGAFLDTVNVPNRRNGSSCGTVTAYRRIGGQWSLEAVLASPAAEGNEQAGIAVALRGDVAVAGARFATGAGAIDDAGAAHVFLRSGSSWSAAATLVAPDSQIESRFGEAVATDGDAVVVGAPAFDTLAGVDAGAVFVFRRTGNDWPLVRIVTAPDGAPNDRFGSAVAIEGDVLFVGAPLHDQPGVGQNRGAVYAYARSGDTWPFAGQVAAPGSAPDARFGAALALDASRLLVGAPGDAPALVAHGSATLFARAGAALTSPSLLVPPGGAAGDAFGSAVALGAATLLVGAPEHNVSEGAGYVYVDGPGGYAFQARLEQPDGPFAETAGTGVGLFGDEALLGANLEDLPPNRAQGAVQRYTRNGTQWSVLPRLDTGDGAAFEGFGAAVAATDRRVAVGAFLDDTVAAGDDAGSVTVFVRNGAGWTREARLEPADAISQDRFGVSLALRDDELLAGSYFNVVQGSINRGAVYAFGRDAGGAWVERQKLIANDGVVNDFLGFSLARDGGRLLVGAPGADAANEDAGAAYVFERGATQWTQVAKLVPPPGPPFAFAGIAVALQGDLALLGAPEFTLGPSESQGVVHVFARNGAGSWQFARTIVAPDGAEADGFGFAVALDGGLAVIGAPNADRNGVDDSGAVYVYAIDAGGETLLGQRTSPAPAESAGYGVAFALDRDRLLVGEPATAGPGGEVGQGRAWLAARAGTTLGEQSVLDAATTKPLQFFGRNLATSFATLAIAAPEFQRDNPREGAVYALDDPDRSFRDGFE